MTVTREALQRILESKGQWNADGFSRKAHGRICRKCRQPMMIGLDSDVGGFPVQCDPAPLTPLGEVSALFAELHTYSIKWMGDRWEIDFRDADRIKAAPAGSQPHVDVLAEHRCGVEFSGAQITDSNAIRADQSKGLHDDCPF